MPTQTLPTKTPSHEDLNIAHIAWFHSPHVALCGKKLKGLWRDNPREVCVVCASMDEDLRRHGQ